MNKIYKKLRKNTKGQYYLLSFCVFLSVLLVTSFSLMYFGPTVQAFLPEGGDTRKMASLLLGVTAVGCFVFTVYASGLFFRFKAREYGILMALGTEKRQLKGLLFKELSVVTALSSFLGLLVSVPASFLIWKLFELFIISNEQMTYRFGVVGFFPGILFACILAGVLGLAGRRFINRSDIMEILRTQQKTEMVKEIKSWTFPVGVVLTILGILLGAGLPPMAAKVFGIGLPGIINLFYLLSLVGIYFILLSAVAQSRTKKNRKKYYGNLVSISLMRFTAKATTKNMCVMTLLIFVCGFSAFYGMQYVLAGGGIDTENSKDFSLHYPVAEDQIGKEEIYDTAASYKIEVTDFTENVASNLVVSYRAKDFDEETSRYIEVYKDKEMAALFVSESDFEKLSGQDLAVEPGAYQTVTTTDYNGFFEYEDGLQEVMNPNTGEIYPLTYGGSVESDILAPFSEPFAYVVGDEEYRKMTEGLDDAYKENIISFNAVNVEESYDFAKDLLAQYVERATDLSNHMGYWNIWAQKMADEAGEEYGYGDKINMTIDNNMLLGDWKYAPQFNIVTAQDRMQLISVYVMLSLYIFIISLAAVSVMAYVRSISVATDNKGLFESLTKLGADTRYKKNILKKQIARIVQYPGVIGCVLGFVFAFVMNFMNDGMINGIEAKALTILAGMLLGMGMILYAVYKYAMYKAEKIVM
ncbi:MAG: ABC transporter permease [Bacillota bacterium]|nr:ABC transporter permease [Bacillota bacterium]